MKGGSPEDAGPEQRQQQQLWPGFSPQGVQVCLVSARRRGRGGALAVENGVKGGRGS